VYYYSIHNIVKIISEVYLYELYFFSCPFFSDPPDMIVRVSNYIFPHHVFKRKIFEVNPPDGSHKKIRYTEHAGKFGAQFEIVFSEQRVEVAVNKLISRSRHVLYVNLVEPLLRFIIISKGFVLLHSACICDTNGRNGLLFSAPPDTGKTTTVLKCLRNGYSFLADDMTILKMPNEALCFPKPMTISAHTFKTATTVSDRPNGSSKGGLKLRSIIHSKTGRQFMRKLGTKNVPIFTINTIGQSIVKPPKFKVEDLLQHVRLREKTSIAEIFFLEKGGEQVEKIDKDNALRRSIENSDDAFIFPPYRQILQYLRIDNKSANDLLVLERSMTELFLSNIREYRVIKSDTKGWFQRVVELWPHIRSSG
jgi:dolichol-phosphate mannosyltransferase